jgi:hypothetical protein
MYRYILRYTGKGSPPIRDIERFCGLPGLMVVSASARHLYLIDATDEAVEKLEEMEEWELSPESPVTVPYPRRTIRMTLLAR